MIFLLLALAGVLLLALVFLAVPLAGLFPLAFLRFFLLALTGPFFPTLHFPLLFLLLLASGSLLLLLAGLLLLALGALFFHRPLPGLFSFPLLFLLPLLLLGLLFLFSPCGFLLFVSGPLLALLLTPRLIRLAVSRVLFSW